MATSSSVNYNLTRDDIISEALEICGVLEEAGTPTANQLTTCARTLNMMIKFWMADGLHLWLNEEIALFPVKNQRQYTFAGSGGDRMCLQSELVTTQLDGTHSSSDTSITVDSTTNMAASDVIGIVTDDSGIHWTTISSVDSSTTLTIASGLDDDASDNDRVYTYTNAFTQRILGIHNIYVRDNDGIDIPIDLISRKEYVDLSDKATTGRVNQAYFDPQRNKSLLNVWPVPDDSFTNEYFRMYAYRLVEDFDSGTDDADFPQEWYLPLAWNLAAYIGIKYGVDPNRHQAILVVAEVLRKQVNNWDSETESIYILPDDISRTHRR